MSPADWRFWSAPFVALIFLSYSAAADQCDTPRDPEAAIIDCTRSINSGKWKGRYLAAFYSNRAAAYNEQGDNDRACTGREPADQPDGRLRVVGVGDAPQLVAARSPHPAQRGGLRLRRRRVGQVPQLVEGAGGERQEEPRPLVS